MKNILLFGNGINRCFGSLSWNDLLKQIADDNYSFYHKSHSPTLEFDKLMLINKYTNLSAINTLDRINDGYQAVYKKYLDLLISDILTTNFDYAIERSLEPKFVYSKNTGNKVLAQETCCSTLRHILLEGKSIFHIHGELSKEKSICLGTLDYARNLNGIIAKITDKSDVTGELNLKDDVFSGTLATWAQFFFTDNIYCVGIGLCDCDIDLWWLIIYRAKLLANGDTRITNKIVYYYTHEGEPNTDFVDLLKSLHIEVRNKTVYSGEWEKAYIDIADDIQKQIDEK